MSKNVAIIVGLLFALLLVVIYVQSRIAATLVEQTNNAANETSAS